MATRVYSFPEYATIREYRDETLRGLFHVEHFRVHFDRSIQKSDKANAATAGNVGSGFGAQASQIGSSLIPGIERQANNPTGFDPSTVNRMKVAGAEAAGGANAAAGGAGRLEAMRTRNPGGFSAALDEAARIKGRQLSQNNMGVENASAELAQKKQADAQRMLAGLYGTDTSNQLHAMGLQTQDENAALEAGKSGWLQNTEGLLDTLSSGASAAAGAKKAFG